MRTSSSFVQTVNMFSNKQYKTKYVFISWRKRKLFIDECPLALEMHGLTRATRLTKG